MDELNRLLRESEFIIVPQEVYHKIIPVEMKDINKFLKERK